MSLIFIYELIRSKHTTELKVSKSGHIDLKMFNICCFIALLMNEIRFDNKKVTFK